MTNADKIRRMTDEELSEFFCNGIENVFCVLCENVLVDMRIAKMSYAREI